MNEEKKSTINQILDFCECSFEEHEAMAVRFNAPMRYENAISQLQGIAFAIAFDNELSRDELKLLSVWLKHNIEFVDAWPLSTIYSLFMRAVEQGEMTTQINDEILTFLDKIGANDDVSAAVFDDISDDDKFKNKTVVVTGNFESGHSRNDIFQMLNARDACLQNNVSNCTKYIIVGNKGSKAWRFGKFGRKIESGIYNRENDRNTKIISEKDFWIIVDR